MKKLKVGGHWYTIRVKKLPASQNDLAQCDYNKATITIDRKIIVKSIRESAFIHEFIHACNSTFGNDGIEHGLLDSLAEQIYQVLKDNNLLNQKQVDFYLE